MRLPGKTPAWWWGHRRGTMTETLRDGCTTRDQWFGSSTRYVTSALDWTQASVNLCVCDRPCPAPAPAVKPMALNKEQLCLWAKGQLVITRGSKSNLHHRQWWQSNHRYRQPHRRCVQPYRQCVQPYHRWFPSCRQWWIRMREVCLFWTTLYGAGLRPAFSSELGLYIRGKLMQVSFLIDTGATESFVYTALFERSPPQSKPMLLPTSRKFCQADGSEL